MSQYTFTTKIGEGGFSIVFNAIDNTTNSPVIIKKIINGASGHRVYKIAENEIKKLQALNHPQIPKILNYFQLDTFMCVVFENHGTTTLRNKMDFYYNKDMYKISALRSVNDIITLFTQLIDILAYIHSINIVHNDLKPENIIWGDDNKIYLIDFGSSAFSNITGSTKRSRTVGFSGSCPEVIKNIKINKENECYVDTWSFGVLFLDVIIGMVILDGTDESESIEEMLINDTWNFNIMLATYFSKNPDLIELWDYVPSDLKIIIRQCLSLNPMNRPKMQDLLLNKKFDNELERKHDNQLRDYQSQTQEKFNNINIKENKNEKIDDKFEEYKKLCEIVNMFNSKDIKPIIAGLTYKLSGFIASVPKKFHINLSMVIKIKNDNVFNIYKYYKNILEDYTWLIKYAYGQKNEKPYINFIFDYYINNIDDLIKDLHEKNRFSVKFTADIYSLRLLKKDFTNTKEYYYADNSLDIDRNLNNMFYIQYNNEWEKNIECKIKTFMKTFLEIYDIDDNTPFNIFKNTDTSNNSEHVSNKKVVICDPENELILNIGLIEGHKNFINYYKCDYQKTKCNNNKNCIRFYKKKDLEGLLYIGKVILELIEFLHPNIISVDENEVIKYENIKNKK